MDDRFISNRTEWLERRITTLGLKKKDVCEGADIEYKTLSNWMSDTTEPTLTAGQWIGLARILQTDLTILLYKFAENSESLMT